MSSVHIASQKADPIKVSVVIPCYNQGRFVDEAVESVLNQTFQDFEIIVVNDGSTDQFTNDLLKNYNKPKTRVLQTTNQGLPSARNNGIREASGEYILPLDADDRIGQAYLEEAVNLLDENPDVGIVYCLAEFFGARSGLWDLPEFDLSRMLVNNMIFCSGFFRKKDWKRVGGYNANLIYGWEDWDFWLSIIELGRKVHRIPRVLFYYRVSESSMVNRMSEDRQSHMRLNICVNHPGLYKNLTKLDLHLNIAQLFVDTGVGFNDTESVSRVISGDETMLEFDVSEFPRIESMRFDPVNDYSVLRIVDMAAITKDNRLVEVVELANNALHRKDEYFIFTTTDPWIILKPPDTEIEKLRFKIEYMTIGQETHKYILENKHKVIMEQAEHIETQLDMIESQNNLIREKDAYIHNLEEEIKQIKSLFVWRFINMMLLLKKGVTTLKKNGAGALWEKTRNYLRRRMSRSSLEMFAKDYDKWVQNHEITDERKAIIKNRIERFKYKPKISIIMPVYNVAQEWLEKAIQSVMAQLYDNWELCIADDASTEKHVKETLNRFAADDSRIKIKFLERNQGIASASNQALSMATGDFVGLLDNDDELTVDALYENVKLLNAHPDADMIYSDEDKLDRSGKRCNPHFKPDWSPDMFLSHMYTCHFGVYRKRIIDEIGAFRKGYDGSQDYDLVLRFIEKTDKIFHIPKILYHWRIIPGSAAQSTDAKSYAYIAAQKALSDYMRRNNIKGNVEDGLFMGSFRFRRAIKGTPEVSIIIPFKDKASVLKTCVHSILKKTDYKNYRIYLVNNRSKEAETIEFLNEIGKNPVVNVLNYDKAFNFSAINNFAVSKTETEYILFLNNDTEVISPGWITSMLEHAQREDVGCVGALLYYPNDTVQHGGVILGLGGIAGHSHLRCRRSSAGYMGRLKVVKNLSAVTAACLMTRKSIFQQIGGFDENITHAFNDVDFCLKMREKNLLIVYTPYAELYHHESLSRGYEDTPEKKERFMREVDYIRKKWGKILDKGDPYYNPNLSLVNGDFSVKC